MSSYTGHYMYACDYRQSSLEPCIDALEGVIQRSIDDNIESGGSLWFPEDIDFTLGLISLAFQNYITHSISDAAEALCVCEKSHKEEMMPAKVKQIDAMANYFKHRNEPELHDRTWKKLGDLQNCITDENVDDFSVIALMMQQLGGVKAIYNYLIEWRNEVLWQVCSKYAMP